MSLKYLDINPTPISEEGIYGIDKIAKDDGTTDTPPVENTALITFKKKDGTTKSYNAIKFIKKDGTSKTYTSVKFVKKGI